jgi:hypothetical protein
MECLAAPWVSHFSLGVVLHRCGRIAARRKPSNSLARIWFWTPTLFFQQKGPPAYNYLWRYAHLALTATASLA